MPARGRHVPFNTGSVKALFNKYGFSVWDPDFEYHNRNEKIKIHNDIHNRSSWKSVNWLLDRVKRGRLVEVDPFLWNIASAQGIIDVFPDPDIGNQNYVKFAQVIGMTGPDEFLGKDRRRQNYHELIRTKALLKKDELVGRLNRNQRIFIERSTHVEDRANLFAMIYMLYILSARVFARERIALAITDDVTKEQSIFPINTNTIQMLKNLVMFMLDPVKHGINAMTESEGSILFSLKDWRTIEIIRVPLGD